MMNRLVGERDYSAQEVGLPLQEDSRVVRSVDCRLPEQHNRPLEFSENKQKRTAYEKYLERPEDLEAVSYFEFLERWNFAASNPGNWRESSKTQGAVLLSAV
jgi:ATP-dependent DNA helicase PIF1